MNNKTNTRLASALWIALFAQTSPVLAEEATFSLTSGVDYSTGKYGQSQSTDITYIPVIAKYETDSTTFKVTVPWLQITGPGDVVGAEATLVRDNLNRKITTESGLGDIVFAATHTIANFGETHPLTLDVTGKIKFATASESKGLGTGKNDYIVALDAYKALGNPVTLFGGLGYKKMGDPDGVNLNNVWFGSMGFSYKFSPSNSAGLMGDYRQKTLDTSAPLREITAFMTHKFHTQYKIQTYLTHGYSDVSADWGGGIMLGHTF